MWFDALVYTAPALRFLVDSVGEEHVTLGSDYPFDMGVDDPVERVQAADLSVDAEQAILSGNAARLLPALAGMARTAGRRRAAGISR